MRAGRVAGVGAIALVVARDTAATAAGRGLLSVQSHPDANGLRRFQAVWASGY